MAVDNSVLITVVLILAVIALILFIFGYRR
jgi:hypothetical protein